MLFFDCRFCSTLTHNLKKLQFCKGCINHTNFNVHCSQPNATMKFSKTIIAALWVLVSAQATAVAVDGDTLPVQVPEADATEVISDLLNLMLDTLDKKEQMKKDKKKSGKIDVIDGVTVHAKSSKDPYRLTPEEKDCMTQALMDSYNSVHASDDYDGIAMNFVSDGVEDGDDEDVSGTKDQHLRRRRTRPYSFRAWYRYSFNYGCTLCGDDFAVSSASNAIIDPQAYLKHTENRKKWETAFCSMLQNGQCEGLTETNHCKIEMDHGIDVANAQA